MAATTGTAAYNIGGKTLHSFLHVSPKIDEQTKEEVIIDLIGRGRKSFLYFSKEMASIDTLIVDEVSMMSSDFFLKMNHLLCVARKRPEPMGKLQIVFVGDFAQLPPVFKKRDETHDARAPAPLTSSVAASSFKSAGAGAGGGAGMIGSKRAREPVPASAAAAAPIQMQMQLQEMDALPPAAPSPQQGFIFRTDLFYRLFDEVVDLRQVFRQADPVFVNMLNDLRFGRMTPEHARLLQTRVGTRETLDLGESTDNIAATVLYARHVDVDRINATALDEIKAPAVSFRMREGVCVDDRVSKADAEHARKRLEWGLEKLKKDVKPPERLILKKDAQVYLSFNLDVEGGLVNGSRGVVIGFSGDIPTGNSTSSSSKEKSKDKDEDKMKFAVDPESKFRLRGKDLDEAIAYPNERMPVVRFACKDGKTRTMEVPYVRWSREEKKTGEAYFWQVPLRLAWATTIHKSQGLSLNRVELCLDSTIFTDGMAYTALSRARDLNSVRISRLQLDVFRANAEVVAFYSKPYAEQRAAWRAVNGM